MAGRRLAGEKIAIKPTGEMIQSARQGLSLQAETGRGESKKRMERANKIVKDQPLNEGDWRGIASFHARYYGDSPPEPDPYPDGSPDARYIASLLLGGKAGQQKSFDLIPQINRQD